MNRSNGQPDASTTPYRSTARFIERVEFLTGVGQVCLASIDFDHMGYFLKTYGSLPVERAIEQCWQLLDIRLQGLGAAVLRSSLDETEVVVPGVEASSLTELLRAHAVDVAAVGSLLLGIQRPHS